FQSVIELYFAAHGTGDQFPKNVVTSFDLFARCISYRWNIDPFHILREKILSFRGAVKIRRASNEFALIRVTFLVCSESRFHTALCGLGRQIRKDLPDLRVKELQMG